MVPTEGTFAVKMSKTGWHDVYTVGLSSRVPEAPLVYALSEKAVQAGKQEFLGADALNGGVILGRVVWKEGTTLAPVGCATIDVQPGAKILYPGLKGDWEGPLSMTPAVSGEFVVTRAPAGTVTLTAKVKNRKVATETVPVFENAFTCGVLLVTGTADPTPSSCPRPKTAKEGDKEG